MTCRTLLIALAAASSALVAGSRATPGDQATFRSQVDAVSVDVSVRSGGTPVAGLTARDFALFDKGVRQQIEVVDTAAVPLDVSLLIDTSESTELFVEQFKNDVRKIAAMLGPGDRLRLLTIDTYVNVIFPMQPAAGHPPIDGLTSNGLTSLYDALVAAMLRPVEVNRRHLVIALTDGVDTISATDARVLRDIARRSEATLHVARRPLDDLNALLSFQCRMMGRCSPSRRSWIPFADHDPAALAEAARLTGGELHEPGIFTGGSPASMFKQILDEFRRSYILRFSPRGVVPTGWHELTVRIPAAPSYSIRARSGYAIGVNGPPPDKVKSASLWAASSRPLAPEIEPIVNAYDRGDYEAVSTALRRLSDPARFIRDFTAAGNPWPANPRREAALVIEVAEEAFSRHDVAARDEAARMLQNYHTLIRSPLGVDRFELLWYWAELTVLEGLVRPEVAMPFVTNAQERCPQEPGFLLARAIVYDQFTRVGVPDPGRAEEASQLFDAATRFESTAAEARLRKAYLVHRLGRHAEALAQLDSLGEGGRDRVFVYLSQLLGGHFHDALDHADEAAAAYHAALRTWPDAQAPRVGLMTLFFLRGDRPGAERMAETIQTASTQSYDPWWQYWQADYRFYPSAIAALRKGAQ